MAKIDEIIKREVNPFDPVTFKTGNFWLADKQTTATVDSIHQEVINQVTDVLRLVIRDQYTRTVLLDGDAGSGKSYLLGRLKRKLNPYAFFVYIDPWTDNQYIWRHTLREMVDSLMKKPAGKNDSQLSLWLKGLSAFRDRSMIKKILGERGLFIRNFKSTYPSGIYQAREFFGVLYALTKPDLYSLGCDWLRGENLDQDDFKALGVSKPIDSEEAARGIIGNFGRISASTKPIVLCFDQAELAPNFADGIPNLQSLFNLNTALHNQYLKNILVIISIGTNPWKKAKERLEQSDLARIEKRVRLKSINLEQAEALWITRLYPLHDQANPKPDSPLYPLQKQALEQKFPGGKAILRTVLAIGGQLFIKHKLGHIPPIDDVATFKLIWLKEFQKTQQKVERIRQFSSVDLTQMLQQTMNALQINTDPHLLNHAKYSSYSFSYQHPDKTERLGIFWNEEPNMTSFNAAMNACEKDLKKNCCDNLTLIRAEKLGQATNRGYKLFKKLFNGLPHRHLTPHLDSIHYLRTYQLLVNSVGAGELVINQQTLDLPKLEQLIRDSHVLQNCPLLQDIGIVSKPIIKPEPDLIKIKDFLLNLVKTQFMIGRQKLVNLTLQDFSHIDESQINQQIQTLCQENQITLIPPDAKPQDQSVCWKPQTKNNTSP
ncbi:MAG: ATP-binding protein [Coleofasciculus sp. G3-WIS-01]|uniref:ATP-binding protein n=1 Tax=Coleofasciculus sp. G3-WIS-01 TaxID=3069528 RepID=UPI0032F4F570